LRALSTLTTPTVSYVDSNNNAGSCSRPIPARTTSVAEVSADAFLERISAARPMPMTYAYPESRVVMSAGAQLWEFDGEMAGEASPLHTPLPSLT